MVPVVCGGGLRNGPDVVRALQPFGRFDACSSHGQAMSQTIQFRPSVLKRCILSLPGNMAR